ncbi:MAG: hypothetical protein JSV56_13150 [Methanomassiliicoccales archaeon]|nr:MAG: hypothetical protein JSV56_13150 [Methanomassiliicoccales archaeon]
MVEIKESERAVIEFTCIPDLSLEKAQKLYDIGFKHLKEFLAFSLDDEAKAKGLVDILNYKILSQFLSVGDEDIPTEKFKCPLCMGIVYSYEEECSECGALLLEEILEVEMEDVYSGLKETIDTVIATPDAAKKYLEGVREGEVDESVEEMEIISKVIGESVGKERGFITTSITSHENENNYLTVISPMGEHEKERDGVFSDLKDLGAGENISYPIEGGNITNRQEEAVRSAVSQLISGQDVNLMAIDTMFILNLKIARFLESKSTAIIEDNRNFLSSLDDISPDDLRIDDIKQMLYDPVLFREIQKIGEKVILDGISFNNDPISFLFVKECLPILRENHHLSIYLIDSVVNITYIKTGFHKDLVHLLMRWKKSA